MLISSIFHARQIQVEVVRPYANLKYKAKFPLAQSLALGREFSVNCTFNFHVMEVVSLSSSSSHLLLLMTTSNAVTLIMSDFTASILISEGEMRDVFSYNTYLYGSLNSFEFIVSTKSTQNIIEIDFPRYIWIILTYLSLLAIYIILF